MNIGLDLTEYFKTLALCRLELIRQLQNDSPYIREDAIKEINSRLEKLDQLIITSFTLLLEFNKQKS